MSATSLQDGEYAFEQDAVRRHDAQVRQRMNEGYIWTPEEGSSGSPPLWKDIRTIMADSE